jgi:hypothetical protein
MDEKVLSFFSDYVKELKKNKLKVIQEMEKSGEKCNKENEKKAQEIKKYLDKLGTLTDEKPRKYDPKPEKEDTNQQRNESKSKINDSNRKIKGVGYGRGDYYSYNNSWDVNKYLDKKQPNSNEIINILKSIIDFINNQSLEKNSFLIKAILESSLLPCLEMALRGGTLLELSKNSELFKTYLQLTVAFSNNKSLIPLLLDISKDYKPVQIESVYKLLSSIYDGAQIFIKCLKPNEKKQNSIEEQLANEIISSYDIVSKNIKSYTNDSGNSKNYTEILKLPVEKSYPLLLRELAFDYISMKKNGRLVHHYATNISGVPTAKKAIRLAEEFAD